MNLLDTDTLTLLFQGHPRVRDRVAAAEEDVGTTAITRIEVMRGRFEAILKAANAKELQRAEQRLRGFGPTTRNIVHRTHQCDGGRAVRTSVGKPKAQERSAGATC